MNEGQPRYQQMDFGLTGGGRPNTLNVGARMPEENANNDGQVEHRLGRENQQAIEFDRNMRSIFSDRALANELHKGDDPHSHDKPNINPDARNVNENLQAALRRLNGLIEGIDPADKVGKFEILGSFISDRNERIGPEGSTTMSLESRKILFEMLVEKIIGFPDISPDSHYQTQIGDIYTQGNLTTLKNLASSSRFNEPDEHNPGKMVNKFGRYIGELSEIRQTSHDLRLNLSLGDNYKKFIQEGLKSRGLDFISNHLAGVREVINLYETHTPIRLSETNSWFQDEDVRIVDARVRKSLVTAQSSNQLTSHDRPLTTWEMERAINIGKTIFRGTQRMAMYATMGNVPPNAESRIGSVPDEYIARSLQGYKITAMRFFYDTENQALHRRILQEMVNQGLKEGEVKDVDDIDTMFGINPDAWIVNGKGAPDLQSHSWRMGLMFLGDILIDVDEGQQRSLLQIVDQITSEEFKRAGLGYHPDIGWGHIPEGSPVREQIEEAIADRMEDYVLGQTMYLSALVRNENVHKDLKKKIWRKIGTYDPLAVATLRPDIIAGLTPAERAVWEGGNGRDGLAERLVLGNLIRLKKEGAKYRDEHGDAKALTREELENESTQFKSDSISDDTREKIMRDPSQGGYFGADYGNELNTQEVELLSKILRATTSDEIIDKLSSTKLPYTVFMDDMPHVAWAKTGKGGAGLADEDGFRLLLSDQGTLGEGWGAMNTLLENPASPKVHELFVTAVEKWAAVRGRPAAQKEIEPFILAYLQMTESTRVSEWIGAAQRALKQPRSEMEEFFRTSFISYDASERAVFLEALSQSHAISDSLADGANFSQLEKLKKKAKAGAKNLIFDQIRTFIQSILPIVGIELAKSMTLKLGDVLAA